MENSAREWWGKTAILFVNDRENNAMDTQTLPAIIKFIWAF